MWTFPPPPGTTPFAENAGWEMAHELFAMHVADTVRGRYGPVSLTPHRLPRQMTWDAVVGRTKFP